jgi:hypothetical protein
MAVSSVLAACGEGGHVPAHHGRSDVLARFLDESTYGMSEPEPTEWDPGEGDRHQGPSAIAASVVLEARLGLGRRS